MSLLRECGSGYMGNMRPVADGAVSYTIIFVFYLDMNLCFVETGASALDCFCKLRMNFQGVGGDENSAAIPNKKGALSDAFFVTKHISCEYVSAKQ